MKPRSSVERFLPVSYLVLSLGLVAALLPTALRPPPQEPPATAEFSPDAPPDDEVVLADLQGGVSRTAGSGIETPGAETVDEAAPPPVEFAARRGRCFGDPPRQLESLYSPPCQPAHTGGNPGATARGVTGDEIRIAFLMNLTGNAQFDGEITDEPRDNESAVQRTYRILRQYFNQNYELYGREMRWFYVQSEREEEDPTTSRSAARRAVEEYGVFAAINETSIPTLDSLTQQGVVTFTLAQPQRSFYAARRPYAWSAFPDSTRLIEFTAEYLCKKLHGRPPIHTDDPSFNYSQPRKFGLLSYQEGVGYTENVPTLRDLMRQNCGAEIAVTVEYGLGTDAGSQDFIGTASTAIARMRAEGVTTIISMQDFISNTVFTQNADQSSYFPEWYVTGMGGTDRVDLFFQAYSPTQWRHAFGHSVYEIPERPQDSECYRAYHTIDPDTNPDGGMCYYMWPNLVQLFGALQLTGPDLTPENLQQALYRWGYHPPDPPWRMAGGYAPGDWSYADYFAEFWYDPGAMHPNGRLGAYRYVKEGRRIKAGEIDSEDPGFFTDPGVTELPRGGTN